MYLTVFTSLRLYELVSPLQAFALLLSERGHGVCLDPPGGDIVSPPFEVAGDARRYWLVHIDRRSGASGQAPPLRAGWRTQEIVFAARGYAPFMLAYGNYSATSGALPIATVVPGYDDTQGLTAGVAAAVVGSPMSVGGADQLRKPADVKRWTLWAALFLGVLILAWMAWRLSREMAATSTGQPTPAGPRRE